MRSSVRFLACAAFFFTGIASSARGAIYTVTNTSDSGGGSLRQAILDANANAGLDTIAFNVSGAGCNGSGVCTIAPTAALPLIQDPALIDGYTQPGASPNTNAQGALDTVLKVVLSGMSVPATSAVYFGGGSDGSTVRGLVINGPFEYTVTSYFSSNNAVTGCFIGTDPAGTTAVPTNRPVDGEFSPGFRVGGPGPADRNLISGNGVQGVYITTSANALVEGNLIGTDATGAAPLGNQTVGLTVDRDCPGTVIRANVVAASQWDGIHVGSGSDTTYGVTVEGNWIGTDVTGTVDLGNGFNGLFVQSKQISVGGIGPGKGNVIAFNGGSGVLVVNSTINVVSNPIRGNSIYDNGQANGAGGLPTLGIDLGNVGGIGEGGLTVNDLGDGDIGPNLNQNFPMITSAVPAAGSTTITGRLNSGATTTYMLDFYSNPPCSVRPRDFLEGKTYLGSAPVTTDASGNAAINAIVPVAIAPGEQVTATATDPSGNTSEFSQRIVVLSTPRSGSPAGAPVTLDGFHFLPGATVTIGGLAATGVNVASYNQITATTPSFAPGTVSDVTVTNTDGSAGTLPNGWVSDFTDVSGSQPFYPFVIKLAANAITAGCGGGSYCPSSDVTRAQMAVFLLRAKNGVCYLPPPATGAVFGDVPAGSFAAAFIEALAAAGVTTGCGGGNYCPGSAVTRDQMAVFLLRTEGGPTYVPPACVTPTFADVPCTSPFARWIEELARRGITAGCGGGNYCPSTPVSRGQMAVFLTTTFGLP